ncbi:MAG: hypothetical protein AB7O49_13285 [Sphingomonadales bacterium]
MLVPAASGWCAPAWAARAEVDGIDLELPLPDGYCERPAAPGDLRNADLARRQPPAASVIAMAEPCGSGATGGHAYGRWLLLRDRGEPVRLAAGSTRSGYLAKSAEGMPRLTPGMVFQIGFLSPDGARGVIGRESAAIYRAIVLPVSSPNGGSITFAGVEGETVLRGRAVAFQMFAAYDGLETYDLLETRVRAAIGEAVRHDPAGVPPRGEARRVERRPSSPRLEVGEVAWLIAKIAAIAAIVFAGSAWAFRRRPDGGRAAP